MKGEEMVRRIWACEPGVWHSDPVHQRDIAQRLGWLTVASAMRDRASELVWFGREMRRAEFTHAVLLGMGGSSLAPEVFRQVFGTAPPGLHLAVLDTTYPATIRMVEERLDVTRTLFIVSSKSGSTIEVTSLFEYFYLRTGKRGSQFIAVTDPGTALEQLGAERGFRRIFLNPPDIGGRYSALSYFGLVPAALLGVDTGRLLDSALGMMRACASAIPLAGNPGWMLGAALGTAAQEGRDKVTLVLDRRIGSFGLWIEQLLAESTGKEGKGLIPIAGELLGPPAVYGPDRVFVAVSLGEWRGDIESRLAALGSAGHPVIRIRLHDLYDLGGEFFRWEFATAVAGALLHVNPFDQPDVQEAKTRTGELLRDFSASGQLPGEGQEPGEAERRTVSLIRGLKPGRDYLCVLAFLPFDPHIEELVLGLQTRLRDSCRVATTFGYGPRYLHSTGQLHKGGPDSGAMILITCDHARDLAIPGKPYTFGQLQRAQALADLQSLTARGRRVVHLHLSSPDHVQVASICGMITRAAAGRD